MPEGIHGAVMQSSGEGRKRTAVTREGGPQVGHTRGGCVGAEQHWEGDIREELLGSDDEKGDLPDDHRVRAMRGAQGDEEDTHSCQMAWQEGLGSAFLKW